MQPAETSELMERLEDSTMALGSLASSRYSGPFRQEIQALSGKLGVISEVMEQWLIVQSMWSYMEAVFSGGDIVKQLPAEAKRFSAIDKSFMKVVAHARETGNILEGCTASDTLRTVLPGLLEQLELCQKSLTAYLGKAMTNLISNLMGVICARCIFLITQIESLRIHLPFCRGQTC